MRSVSVYLTVLLKELGRRVLKSSFLVVLCIDAGNQLGGLILAELGYQGSLTGNLVFNVHHCVEVGGVRLGLLGAGLAVVTELTALVVFTESEVVVRK